MMIRAVSLCIQRLLDETPPTCIGADPERLSCMLSRCGTMFWTNKIHWQMMRSAEICVCMLAPVRPSGSRRRLGSICLSPTSAAPELHHDYHLVSRKHL